MTHYLDLAPCDYFDGVTTGPLQAVGWLEPEYGYTTGSPGQEFYDRLNYLFKDPWQPSVFMGWHECRFCRYDGYQSYYNLFIPGNGVTNVAPQGILHYIAVHDYSPPPEFRQAVMQWPATDTSAYFEALQVRGCPIQVARPPAR